MRRGSKDRPSTEIGRHARVPIVSGQHSRGSRPLDALPELDENLEPKFSKTLTWFNTILQREYLDMQKELNRAISRQFLWGTDPEVRERMLERAAWEAAVQWIEQKHAPPAPEPAVVFDWNWPNPDVSQSPRPLGVGDLEKDWEDDDYDD